MSYLYCINSIKVELCLKGGKNYAFIMDTIKKLFGRRLAELRGKRGWTQEKLAEKIGIDQRNVSKIENGNTFPGRCLAKIPEAFGFPIKDFFDWEHLSYTDNEKREFIKKVIDDLPPELLTLCFRIANYWYN